MSTTLEALEAEVLKLAPGEKSHLLERLIVSLDEDVEVEEAWAREADRKSTRLNSSHPQQSRMGIARKPLV